MLQFSCILRVVCTDKECDLMDWLVPVILILSVISLMVKVSEMITVFVRLPCRFLYFIPPYFPLHYLNYANLQAILYHLLFVFLFVLIPDIYYICDIYNEEY